MENTELRLLARISAKDHLHIRGEHRLLNAVSYWSAGSPPHTWRTRQFKGFDTVWNGITSTYVENTKLVQTGQILQQDHLHIRGEHPSIVVWIILFIGSPPHTWRTRKAYEYRLNRLRITSTYVENTK
ncbi:hypothetical protein LAB52_05125 [Lactobacillus amylovorus GRL1118]|nr:hypothetical protein LAB52_05125 [Lactobacillus amylovorus GRL1118]